MDWYIWFLVYISWLSSELLKTTSLYKRVLINICSIVIIIWIEVDIYDKFYNTKLDYSNIIMSMLIYGLFVSPTTQKITKLIKKLRKK